MLSSLTLEVVSGESGDAVYCLLITITRTYSFSFRTEVTARGKGARIYDQESSSFFFLHARADWDTDGWSHDLRRLVGN